MQQTNDTVKNVHIKVQCENEFRRFVLSEVTYANLVATIRSLLAFSPETDFKMSYLDDEGDRVLFATDNELLYAVALSKSPLKIFVKTCTATATPLKFTFVPTAAEGETIPEEKTWRGRGGVRGCGRGRGRGGKGADWSERLDAKIARLTERHAVLTAKLIENDFSEEKVRGIEWRLSHLQNKIDTLKSKKEQLGDASAVQNKEENQKTETVACDEYVTPSPDNDEDAQTWHTRGRRGCGRGRGRGAFNRSAAEGEEGCEKKRGGAFAFAKSTPEGQAAFEKVQACREAVTAARRDKEGKEVILAKIEELKVAKANWKDLKLALWQENRAATAPRKEAK